MSRGTTIDSDVKDTESLAGKRSKAVIEIYDHNGDFDVRYMYTENTDLEDVRSAANGFGTVLTVCRVTIVSGVLGDNYSTVLPEGHGLNLESRLNARNYNPRGKPAECVYIFVVRQPPPPKCPKRSPLHEKALIREELKFGLRVQTYHEQKLVGKGVIVSEPFQMLDPVSSVHGAWKVKVAVQHSDEIIVTEWFLADYGIEPYSPKSPRGWNTTRYTLAVED